MSEATAVSNSTNSNRDIANDDDDVVVSSMTPGGGDSYEESTAAVTTLHELKTVYGAEDSCDASGADVLRQLTTSMQVADGNDHLAAASERAEAASSNADANPQQQVEQEKELRSSIIRAVLPACQPQEGSPANTFTDSELQELQAAFRKQAQLNINNVVPPQQQQQQPPAAISVTSASATATTVAPSAAANSLSGPTDRRTSSNSNVMDIMVDAWEAPPSVSALGGADLLVDAEPSTVTANYCCPQEAPQEAPQQDEEGSRQEYQREPPKLDWHGAPRFNHKNINAPREFRQMVREGKFTGPTNGVCGGFLQCNLVILPKDRAFDFLLFCQRNPKACPLIEVCDAGSPCPIGVAPGADLRTDVPKYAIYRNGKLEREVSDVTELWQDDFVAFLIGCSFSYDGALMDAGIPLRSAEAGKNVPMYLTNLPCRPAGSLKGNVVVSMKPIPAMDISTHIEITSKYKHAHGGPVCVGGNPQHTLGIANLNEPDWGEAIEVRPDEVPVFHACGVTPQAVLMASNVPFAITHAAGHMFVTDLPADMGV